ncbi:MAG: SAM-dependent methyltransferase [Bacteroidetes bacterium]|nr:SAM-dependent methyltransferase [Bacteroidota bacterium]
MPDNVNSIIAIPGSFRDPDGRVFLRENILYRSVAFSYKENYLQLIRSGLYSKLTALGFLIHHDEVDVSPDATEYFKLLKPKRIKFISYPYEWSFNQLKDAAFLVLEIQRIALAHGMTLKDSSAFNIQFNEGKPVLIDTLSFEICKEGEPWVAYKQFCQHFLAPLALMSFKDPRLIQLFKNNLDGIPLDLAASLLPAGSRFNTGILIHIHLHLVGQNKFSEKKIDRNSGKKKFSRNAFSGLVESLGKAIAGLRSPGHVASWYNYYADIELPGAYIPEKIKMVNNYCEQVSPHCVWDLGANTGVFSKLDSLKNSFVVSMDSSYECVDKIYTDCRENGSTNILPLVIDVMNPSPGLGWENKERDPVFKRGAADLVMALALVHHLAITNNLPLNRIASFFNDITKHLVIEFVPKEDANAQKLFRSKADIIPDYTVENFEAEFSNYFAIKEKIKLAGTERVLYLMRRITD